MAEPIRVLIADDDPLVRGALAGYIEAADDMVLVGTRGDGETTAERVEAGGVDVVLMDVRMPVLDGLGAARRLARSAADTRVVMLTTFDDGEALGEAIAAGANGFLLKDSRPQLIVEAVRAAASGGQVLAHQVTSATIPRLSPRPPEPPDLGLSPRELDVLRELCRAASNAEIAVALFLSESTVKAYVGSIMAKLDCPSRLKVVVRAFELGLADRPT